MPRYARFGWLRGFLTFRSPIASGTAAEEYVTDVAPGFEFTIEKVSAVVVTAFTGAGATRVFRVLKGASTVVATATIVLADGATKGAVIDVPVTAANASFADADTLSIDTIAAGAVSFTAGELMWVIKYRTKPQQQL